MDKDRKGGDYSSVEILVIDDDVSQDLSLSPRRCTNELTEFSLNPNYETITDNINYHTSSSPTSNPIENEDSQIESETVKDNEISSKSSDVSSDSRANHISLFVLKDSLDNQEFERTATENCDQSPTRTNELKKLPFYPFAFHEPPALSSFLKHDNNSLQNKNKKILKPQAFDFEKGLRKTDIKTISKYIALFCDVEDSFISVNALYAAFTQPNSDKRYSKEEYQQAVHFTGVFKNLLTNTSSNMKLLLSQLEEEYFNSTGKPGKFSTHSLKQYMLNLIENNSAENSHASIDLTPEMTSFLKCIGAYKTEDCAVSDFVYFIRVATMNEEEFQFFNSFKIQKLSIFQFMSDEGLSIEKLFLPISYESNVISLSIIYQNMLSHFPQRLRLQKSDSRADDDSSYNSMKSIESSTSAWSKFTGISIRDKPSISSGILVQSSKFFKPRKGDDPHHALMGSELVSSSSGSRARGLVFSQHSGGSPKRPPHKLIPLTQNNNNRSNPKQTEQLRDSLIGRSVNLSPGLKSKIESICKHVSPPRNAGNSIIWNRNLGEVVDLNAPRFNKLVMQRSRDYKHNVLDHYDNKMEFWVKKLSEIHR